MANRDGDDETPEPDAEPAARESASTEDAAIPADEEPIAVPGRPATPRNRAKSAALWGGVGFFAFLVVAQGYLLLGGDLPVRHATLFLIAVVVGVTSGGIAYLTEHRLSAKGRV